MNRARFSRRQILSEVARRATRFSSIFIDGVEVNQAIQYRKAAEHLTDPGDRAPDNSIRLVADKPAMVRVYVHSMRLEESGVTGKVTVQRRRHGIWMDSDTLTQVSPFTITATRDPVYATERGSLWNSLNFIIPATTMRGHLRLKVHVEAAGRDLAADSEVDIDASLLQTLRVRGIPVRYWGPDAAGNQIQLAAPTLADFQAAAVWTLQAWPVSKTPDIGLAGTFTWSQPLTGNINAGSCPTSWNNLLFWLGVARVIDGNRPNHLYYALMPRGIPTGGAGGCGGGDAGVGAGFVGGGQTMCHELGHVLQFTHAPCNLVMGDPNDPSYPAYEPYDTTNARTASIGEYGLDPTNRVIYPPNAVSDFMSYCNPNWVSIYHYQKLLQNSMLDPRWVRDPRDSYPPYLENALDDPIPHYIPDPPPPWVGRQMRRVPDPDPVPLVIVTGLIRDERIEIDSVLRLTTGPATGGTRLEGTSVELLDEQGNVLERSPLRKMNVWACCECGEGHGEEPTEGIVQALLPDPGRGVSLRLVRNGEELWSRLAPDGQPEIWDVTADVEGDTLHVRWSSSSTDSNEVERAVRWSADDGRTWQALAMMLQEDEAYAPLEMFTSGPALVQVLVSDGFHTTLSDVVRVDVPVRPPHAVILWPRTDGTAQSGELVRLWGMATASDGRVLPEDALHWELDSQPVGDGSEVWVELPDWEGEHCATLRASDGGLEAKASVMFMASASGRAPIRQNQC